MNVADEIIPVCQLLVLLVAVVVACGGMKALSPLILFIVVANLLLAIYQQAQHPEEPIIENDEDRRND